MTTLRNPLFALSLALIVGIMSIARVANPPNGRTGAPGDGLCTDCHSAGNPAQDGMVSISGLPAQVDPSTTYSLVITVSNPDGLATHGGAQMTGLGSDDDIAGTMTNAGGGSTITSSGGREYLEHAPAMNFGAGTEVSYTVDWTSPAGPDGDVITFYASSILSNGNGSNGGDRMVTTTSTGTLMGASADLSVEIIEAGNVRCNGDDDGFATAVASDGTSPYTYLWSDGQVGETALNLTAGDYSVTVTDAVDATASASITITQPDVLIIDLITSTDVSCNGEADGSATVAANGGTEPFSYLWQDGSTDPTNDMLEAGDQDITVTDANGCSTSTTILINEPDQLIGLILAQSDLQCSDSDDGSATVGAVGGTMPFLYEWSNGAIDDTQDNLPPGSYTVTVTDSKVCTDIIVIEISAPDSIEINPMSTSDPRCSDSDDGTIEISATGGTGTIEILWSTGATTASIDNLSGGDYSVTVTDGNDCSASASYTLTAPAELLANVTTVDESVDGAMDGSASSAPTGGTTPYTYLWSTGSTEASIDNLSGDSYTVTVTDAQNCTDVQTVVINSSACDLTIVADVEPNACAGDNTGRICLTVTGGQEPITYAWSDGDNSSCREDLLGDNYSVTVTDADSCVEIRSFSLEDPTPLRVVAEVSQPQCFEDLGRVEISVSGGIAPYKIEPSAILEDLLDGDYAVTVRDQNNCTETITVTITSPEELTVVLDSVTSATDLIPGAAFITIAGGTGEYSPVWLDTDGNTVALSEDLLNVSQGFYIIMITDENGCETMLEVEIPLQVSTSQEFSDQLSVYPIPAVNQLHIGLSSEYILKAELYDMTGQIFTAPHGTSTVDVSQLSAGYYVLILTTDKNRYAHRVLVGL